jgi:hypothetical protein
MNQTGHPLADAGRAIAAVMQNKRSLEETHTGELNASLSFLVANVDPNKKSPGSINKLKILPAYWQNNPLMGLNLGRLNEYQKKLNSLLGSDTLTRPGHCQICGIQGIFSDANRSWLPLAAGADADPCSLPNLRGKFLCADCFRAIVLLPLGCRFSKAGPYFFHLADPELQVEAMEEGVNSIQDALLQKKKDSASLKENTRLSGRLELLEIVSGSRLWDYSRGGRLSRRAGYGATIISFSNSGTSAAWNQLHLPAQALDFFASLTESGLRKVFLEWAEKSANSPYESLCDDVESRRSIAPMLASIVKHRKVNEGSLTTEEKQVLRIYEDEALGKKERFEALERVAHRINDMEERYRDSFVKQLANLRSKTEFLRLLTKFAQSEKTDLRLTVEEYRILHEATASEAINLLYLLCVAEDAR